MLILLETWHLLMPVLCSFVSLKVIYINRFETLNLTFPLLTSLVAPSVFFYLISYSLHLIF